MHFFAADEIMITTLLIASIFWPKRISQKKGRSGKKNVLLKNKTRKVLTLCCLLKLGPSLEFLIPNLSRVEEGAGIVHVPALGRGFGCWEKGSTKKSEKIL